MPRRTVTAAVPSRNELEAWERARQAPRKLRLYADHDVPALAVQLIRRAGINVYHVDDSPKDLNQGDGFHYRRARQVKRMLFARDPDYLNDRRHALRSSPGVLVIDDPRAARDPVLLAQLVNTLNRWLIRDGLAHFRNMYVGTKFRASTSRCTLRYIRYDSRVEEMVIW